ncbi:Beta-glucuronosyltransferase [Nymphaea thermarum]|nr:Beta-glucuronosyltransferase [Nymphaea thermarum]
MKNLMWLNLRMMYMEKKWMLMLGVVSFVSLLLLFIMTSGAASSLPFFGGRSSDNKPVFVEAKLSASSSRPSPSSTSSYGSSGAGGVRVPRIAYLISGSVGDGEALKRTLEALYHPINEYVVHLDLEAPMDERLGFIQYVRNHPVYAKIGNVYAVTKANLVTYRGPTMVANTLHAAAILLKKSADWDWFINLSASDYPLITQDDLLHTLTDIPRGLNFIEHTSDIGWKEFQRAKPIIIDPGLYMTKKSDVFWVSERRSVPTAFKLFTGSAWMMLSRSFIEFCLWGWDNLPRTVLMYYANFISSPEGYFHTVICNVNEFRNTTVNHDLHFISWDNPPKQHPHFLNLEDFQRMTDSNAPFARKFHRDDPVLEKIDKELLGRSAGTLVPGGWCAGETHNGSDPCSVIGDRTLLKPGPGAARLKNLITGLLSAEDFREKQCM